MVDFNKILKRADYARLTIKVKMYAESLAFRIRKKMFELDIQDMQIKVDDVTICCQHVTTKSQYPGRRDFLAICTEYEIGIFTSLEDIGKEYYYDGCFNTKIIGCSNNDALRFLNKARAIVCVLSKIEQSKVNNIDSILNDVRNLNV